MPLVYAALEAPTPVVQEKALRIIPSLSESLDYTTVKNSLFPRVQVLFAQTTLLSVKVSTLICFHSMIKVIDKVQCYIKDIQGSKQENNKYLHAVYYAREACASAEEYKDKRAGGDGKHNPKS